MPSRPTDREREALELLPETLELAFERPFYKRLWKTRPKRWSSESLLSLPLIDKATVAANVKGILDPRTPAQAGVVSSGSTGQRLLRVHRSPAELDAVAEDAQTNVDWTPSVSDEVAGGWALEVRAMHHGIPERPAAANRLRVPWTYTLTSLRLLREMLESEHEGRRVTSMIIGSGAISALTAWLQQEGVAPSSFAVRLIGTNGYRLTPTFRSFISQMWNAELLDNFSLSEFSTTAIECPRCGFHHWLRPPLHAEVLDPFSLKPLTSGVGLLVLTGLHPFVQAMPLIRYRTGDLVEVGEVCSLSKDRGFKYRGREKWSLLDPKFGVLVAWQDVQDFLESRPEVARHPHPLEQLGIVKSPDIGAVKVELSREGLDVQLRVELRFDPIIHTAAAEKFAMELAEFLLSRNPGLRALDKKHQALVISVEPPGSLTAPWAKF